jgi:4-amino-4-deoxy-L-arabinose transferase-like glycosyltransferase
LLTFLIGKKAGGIWTGIGSALLLAISPHHIVASGYLLTEVLFTFLLILTIWLTLRNWEQQGKLNWWLIGMIGGSASLVRPVFLVFPAVVYTVMYMQHMNLKKGLFSILLMVSGMAIVNLPWYAWRVNHPAGPEPSLLASAIQLGGYPDLIYKDPSLKGFPYREDPENDRSADVYGAVKVVLERAAHEPLRYLKWYLIGKPVMFWQANNLGAVGGAYIYPVINSIYDRQIVASMTMSVMMNLHALMAIIAAATGIWILRGAVTGGTLTTPNPALLISAMMVLAFTFIHTVLAPLQRYAYPFYPYTYLLAAVGIGQLRPIYLRIFGKSQ